MRSCDRGCLACGAGPTNADAELRQRAANFTAAQTRIHAPVQSLAAAVEGKPVARVGRVAEDARVRRRQAVFRVGAAVAVTLTPW